MRRQGIVLVLTDGLGRVAFQQRDDAVLADGTPIWGLFGGWIEDSESPAAAALREVREELGCELDPDLLRPLGVHAYDSPGSDFDSHVFGYAVTTELDRAVLQEGLGWAFLEPVALRGRLLPNHEEIIDAFTPS